MLAHLANFTCENSEFGSEFSIKPLQYEKYYTSSKHFSEIFSTDFYQRLYQLACWVPWLPEYMTPKRLRNTSCVMKRIPGPCWKDCPMESVTHRNTYLELGLQGM